MINPMDLVVLILLPALMALSLLLPHGCWLARALDSLTCGCDHDRGDNDG